jgi:hypothetical protein
MPCNALILLGAAFARLFRILKPKIGVRSSQKRRFYWLK